MKIKCSKCGYEFYIPKYKGGYVSCVECGNRDWLDRYDDGSIEIHYEEIKPDD